MSEEIYPEVVHPLEFTKEDIEWMELCMRVFGRTGFARTREVSREELKKMYPTASD